MDHYLVLVIALLILAVADLMVGVSNDAVNFLTSAIGSKVAPRSIILGIAAAGVFVGASFSSGMMEVARKGIFNPEFFSYADVMVVFLAVMITDILLLDLFNSFGLPTSTTVSIVFELLGASVVTGLLAMNADPTIADSIWEVINHQKASQIIAGIFLSVGVAFSIGALVQFFTRLLFTFRYQERLDKYGALFAGFAISIIVYFLLVKGIKGAAFVTPEFAALVNGNGWSIVLGTFVVSAILVFIAQKLFKANPLKLVVLLGTFALAMAFAGNDLVNFIGVPISGYQSYTMWMESGLAAENFMMSNLSKAVPTPSLMLYGAGVIMVLTLWFSAKAKKVTDTSVDLGSQGSVDERFKPNLVANGIIRSANAFAKFFDKVTPRKTTTIINWRFRSLRIVDKDQPAFDLVRASVNLMVASILIAFASSLKLPLSTTYVSFMVAMGASLADRAWGEGSAPYRVAGVINVIGGWFLTAIGAFTASGIVALIIYFGGFWVAMAMFVIAFGLLVRNNLPKRNKATA
ncbi:MAG: inorganic phosphate transporter [Bacteroidota bacterium]